MLHVKYVFHCNIKSNLETNKSLTTKSYFSLHFFIISGHSHPEQFHRLLLLGLPLIILLLLKYVFSNEPQSISSDSFLVLMELQKHSINFTWVHMWLLFFTCDPSIHPFNGWMDGWKTMMKNVQMVRTNFHM